MQRGCYGINQLDCGLFISLVLRSFLCHCHDLSAFLWISRSGLKERLKKQWSTKRFHKASDWPEPEVRQGSVRADLTVLIVLSLSTALHPMRDSDLILLLWNRLRNRSVCVSIRAHVRESLPLCFYSDARTSLLRAFSIFPNSLVSQPYCGRCPKTLDPTVFARSTDRLTLWWKVPI